MIKRCIVCGTLTDFNNTTANSGDQNVDKCQRCLNSTKAASLKKNSPVKSLFYVFDGFKYLFQSKKLIKLSIVPLLITFFVLAIIYGTSIYLFITGLNQYLPSVEEQGFLINTARSILSVFGTLLITILILFLFLPVSSLICIPFNDIISLEAENIFLGEQNQNSGQGKFLEEVKVGLKEVFKLLFLKLIIIILALPLLFIPVAGWVLFIFIISLITAVDFLDVVMARKKYTLKEKIAFIKMNKMAFTMFSIPFLLLFWIPVIQIFIIPGATIGGTKFFLETEKKDI